jgi:hypothetical protein
MPVAGREQKQIGILFAGFSYADYSNMNTASQTGVCRLLRCRSRDGTLFSGLFVFMLQ